jgi:hypothetical protein
MSAARSVQHGELLRPDPGYSTGHFTGATDLDWPRRLKAVVEIIPGPNCVLPESLLRNIYCASQGGVIALALTDVTAAIVNKVMDRIVPLFPLSIPGIRYIDTANRSMLARIICRADVAFGDTVQFRTAALEVGFEPPLPFSWQFGRGDGPMASSACTSPLSSALLSVTSLRKASRGEVYSPHRGENPAKQDAGASNPEAQR